MNKIVITFLNCIRLRSFKYWKLLYNEFNYPVHRIKKDYASLDCNLISILVPNDKSKTSTYLLHEIGHYVSFGKMKGDILLFKLSKVRRKGLLIAEEKKAWKYALQLSKKYDLQLCPKLAKECLSSYGVQYAVLNNLCKKENRV